MAKKSWNSKGVGESSGSKCIEMVWTCGENGSVPYGFRGVESRSKWSVGAGKTKVRLDIQSGGLTPGEVWDTVT